MADSLDGVYADYLQRQQGGPRRSRREIRALVQAAGLPWQAVDDGFWARVRPAWLSGADDITPFEDDEANARYRAIAIEMGLLD